MKDVLIVVGGFVAFIIAEAVGAIFFWIIQGRKETIKNVIFNYNTGRSVVRNEFVGGIILFFIIYLFLILIF